MNDKMKFVKKIYTEHFYIEIHGIVNAVTENADTYLRNKYYFTRITAVAIITIKVQFHYSKMKPI